MDSASQPSAHKVFIIEGTTSNLRILAHVLREAGLTVLISHCSHTRQAVGQPQAESARLDTGVSLSPRGNALLLARAAISVAPEAASHSHTHVLNLVEVTDGGRAHDHRPSFDNRTNRQNAAAIAPPSASLIGTRPLAQDFIRAVRRIAGSTFNVLITGEPETGQEICARAIHDHSPRDGGPFVTVDCADLEDHTGESESPGALRGGKYAVETVWQEKYEAATGGSLFLDDISRLRPYAQKSLVRLLQEQGRCSAASVATASNPPRIIAASGENLLDCVIEGSFHPELYYLLSECIVRSPGSYERPGDIPFLVDRFFYEANGALCKSVLGSPSGAETATRFQTWPRSMRQPRDIACQADLIADEQTTAEPAQLGTPVSRPSQWSIPTSPTVPGQADEWANLPLREIVRPQKELLERDLLTRTLDRASGNKALAARWLSINYRTLVNKLRDYGIALNDRR